MLFSRTLLILFIACFTIVAGAQTRYAEATFLHTQTTLPWKRLPGHSLHPGFRLGYVWGRKTNTHWLKEAEIGFQHHPELYNSLLLGSGIRYSIFKPARKILLQTGIVLGLALDKPTQSFYAPDGDGGWPSARAGWQAKGYCAFLVKAGYSINKLLAAGMAVRIWAEAPYVQEFSTVLPHRNYEIFFRYRFSKNDINKEKK